jgi:hypothetical protein
LFAGPEAGFILDCDMGVDPGIDAEGSRDGFDRAGGGASCSGGRAPV